MTKGQGTPPRVNTGMPPPAPLGGGKLPPKDSVGVGWENIWNTTAAVAALPSLGRCLKTSLGVTVALYILNQKHVLPRPLSGLVSQVLFWPTLPITVSRRLGEWETVIDDTVVMGGAPFGFAKLPEKLYQQYGVRGVVNLCEEYPGPDRRYKQLGIRHLRLPTTDHFEPTVEDLETAVNFISELEAKGEKAYVHCRAGHGRSAAVVFAWLLSKNPNADLQQLNNELCAQRNVRKTLWKQRSIIRYHSRLRGLADDNDDATMEEL